MSVVAVPTAPGTGIYMRVRRGERYENVLIEEMSEDEIREHFSHRQDAWKFIAALVKKSAPDPDAPMLGGDGDDADEAKTEYGIRLTVEQAELVQILLALTPDQRGLAKAALWLIVSPSTTGLARGAIDGMMMHRMAEMGASHGMDAVQRAAWKKKNAGAAGAGIGPSSAADRREIARDKKTNGGEGGGG